ncbi:hypothetical protein E2562_018586 [Oryza meyeriana var. granulata]|uniref:Uncharacterized protein n=1 Tax=Oryza meyeriana var. granulata TaxID=110450 RepID=A0A6G1F9L1_9ORYZ|nr:hypothetical protein E2562_018586 [Oryza meyeriana var. granulata]
MVESSRSSLSSSLSKHTRQSPPTANTASDSGDRSVDLDGRRRHRQPGRGGYPFAGDLAFGHMIPSYLELSKRLAASMHFRSCPLPAAADADAEGGGAAGGRRVDGRRELVKKACDGLAAPFAAFLADACAAGRNKPDWIINDFCRPGHHWLPPIADEHRVPCATFQIIPAAMSVLGPRWPVGERPVSPLGDGG